jgi:fructose-specific component phosphotransferase system IIB-like protein
VYAKQDVSEQFGEWKHYLMHEIMTAAAARVAGRREGRP